METWEVVVLSLFLCLALAALLLRGPRRRLPPGPPAVPILGNLMWLTRSSADLESALQGLWSKYGPVVTIHLGSHRIVVVGDLDLAHEMLVKHGAVFADRPTPFPRIRLLTSNRCNISTSGNGPLWRLLRRNLAEEMLNPWRVRHCADSQLVLHVVLDKLRIG